MATDTQASRLPWYSLVTGLVILLGFTWLTAHLIGEARTGQQFYWDRLLLIFNTVQTFSVAAAGALLGTSVQQARVASAEARADAARTEAKDAQVDAVKAEAARKLIGQLDIPEAQNAGGSADLASLRAVLS